MHLCVTFLHTKKGVAEQFVKDVEDEISVIMKNPDAEVVGKVRT